MFQHTAYNSIEQGITHALIDKYWAFLAVKIKDCPLFDDRDKNMLLDPVHAKQFIREFIMTNKEYIVTFLEK